MKLNEEPGMINFELNDPSFYFLGFSKMIEYGYDDNTDLQYIVLQKLDEDLNTIINRSKDGCLSL